MNIEFSKRELTAIKQALIDEIEKLEELNKLNKNYFDESKYRNRIIICQQALAKVRCFREEI